MKATARINTNGTQISDFIIFPDILNTCLSLAFKMKRDRPTPSIFENLEIDPVGFYAKDISLLYFVTSLEDISETVFIFEQRPVVLRPGFDYADQLEAFDVRSLSFDGAVISFRFVQKSVERIAVGLGLILNDQTLGEFRDQRAFDLL